MAETNPFIQSFKIGDLNAGVEKIIEGTYIERINLTCPKLILQINDSDRLYQDDGGLKIGSKITLSMGDIDARGNALFQDEFIVGSCFEKDGVLVVEAMQKDIFRIKQPLPEPQFFVDKSPVEILKAIFPHHKIDADQYHLKCTYHCLTNATLSMMLERLKRDLGAAIWLSRGIVYLKSLKLLSDKQAAFKMDYLKNASDNPLIQQYEIYSPEQLQRRKYERDYYTWNIVDGIESISIKQPKQYLSCLSEKLLRNHNLFLVPVLEALLAGDGNFSAGQVVHLSLLRLNEEAIFNEAVPAKEIILGVRHYQKRERYLSMCEFGVVVDANN